MGKEVLIGAEKDILRNFVEERGKTGKTLIAFGEMKGLLVELKKVNSGRDRVPTTIWGCLKRMPETAGFTFGAGNRELTDAEIKFLLTFVGQRQEEKKSISYREAESLVAEMAKETGEKQRHTTTLWNYFKKAIPDLVKTRLKKDKEAEAERQKEEAATVSVAVPILAAHRILNDIRTIADVMGKPADYLKPLEELLAKEANRKDIVALEKKIKCLEDKLAILAKRFRACKKALRITCRIRQEAVSLTKATAEIKEQDGVDIPALIAEEE